MGKTGYGSPNSLEESATMVADCKAWKDMCEKVDKTLESGKASAQKMTIHDEQDKLYTEMKARWAEVDKSCKEWTAQMEQIKDMFVKKQEMMKKMSNVAAPDPAQLAV